MKNKFKYYYCPESVDRSIILNEAAKRDIQIIPIADSRGHYLLDYGGHLELVGYLNTSALGFVAGRVTKNKHQTNWLLKRVGLNVPEGRTFSQEEELEMQEYIGMRKIVIKPNKGAQGKNVWIRVTFQKALGAAKTIWESKDKTLVEEYFPGNEYRVFATRDQFVAATQRIPANVTGNGKNSLQELIEQKNSNRGPGQERFAWPPIPIDDIVLAHLTEQSRDLTYIPIEGAQIFLRQNSNLSTGGDSITIPKEECDSRLEEIAMRTLHAIPGMAYAGIDIICKNISNLDNYKIIEINKSPGMTNHHYPNAGKPQNTAGALIDQIFPETKNL